MDENTPAIIWASLATIAIVITTIALYTMAEHPTFEQLQNATSEAHYWKTLYMETQTPIIHVTASAYKFHGRQTANGTIVTKGHIAVSRDLRETLLNEKVEVYSLEGDLIGTFLVTDTMAAGLRNSVDIYMKSGAKEFGRKPVTLRVITKEVRDNG